MGVVNVCEVFESIQGESTYAGLPCFFIRLVGCNLRCRYCDTKYSYRPGARVEVAELVRKCKASPSVIAEITGGEPLMQEGFGELAKALRDRPGKQVLVETNGSIDISVIPAGVVAVVDVKCPSSGQSRAMDPANMSRLRKYDEVKFVISNRADYVWARQFVAKHRLEARCNAVLFSPAWGRMDPERLAGWIARDGQGVMFQVQLHRILGAR
jgi:7-carboxy-7-deazaguanine synthase